MAKATWRSIESEEPVSAPPPAWSAGLERGAAMAAAEPAPPIAPVPPLAEDPVAGVEAGDEHPRFPRHGPLPLWVRIAVFLVGWLLVLVGIAGLVLPGIQGVFTILVGAALLSLVSEIAYTLLRKCLHRWPRAWDRVERFRDRAHDKLHQWFHREKDSCG